MGDEQQQRLRRFGEPKKIDPSLIRARRIVAFEFRAAPRVVREEPRKGGFGAIRESSRFRFAERLRALVRDVDVGGEQVTKAGRRSAETEILLCAVITLIAAALMRERARVDISKEYGEEEADVLPPPRTVTEPGRA